MSTVITDIEIRACRGKDDLGVEDIERLVFHRAHVEIVDRNDVEDIEVIFAAIDVFIPFHRALERRHRVVATRLVAGIGIDVKIDAAP